MWRLATSLPQRRNAGPNAGLHVSTYVLGIGQTNTSGSNRIDRYSLWKSPPRASFRVVLFKSHKNPFWCSLANPFRPPTTTQKVVKTLFIQVRALLPSCCVPRLIRGAITAGRAMLFMCASMFDLARKSLFARTDGDGRGRTALKGPRMKQLWLGEVLTTLPTTPDRLSPSSKSPSPASSIVFSSEAIAEVS